MSRRAPLASSLAIGLACLLVLGCGNEGDPFGLIAPEARVAIVSTRPVDRETGVSVDAIVTVAFPADLDLGTVNPAAFVLTEESGLPVARTVAYDATSRVVSVRPARRLRPTNLHQMAIQGVRSRQGVLFAPTVFSFATGEDTDRNGPRVIAVSPIPDQANVPRNANVVVTFDRAMDRDSLFQAFSISDSISGALSLDATERILTFTPGALLPLETTVRVQVAASARDRDGVPLRSDFLSTFRTPDRDAFRILQTTPADGSLNAAPTTLLVFRFSEPVDRSTVTTNFSITATGLAVPVPIAANFTFSQNDQVVTYDPAPGFPAFVGWRGGSTVTATLAQEIRSASSGARLPAPFVLDFGVENIAPQVVSTVPQNGAVDVPTTQVVRFRFSEPLDPATVVPANFTVSQGPTVAGTLTLEDSGRTVVFTPTTGFQNVVVPVQIVAGTAITDRGGTPLAGAVTISFSIDDSPPFVTQTFPLAGAQDVPVTLAPERRVRFRFNEALDQAATRGTFAIAPDATGGNVTFPDPFTLVYVPPVLPTPVDPPLAPNQKLVNGRTNYSVTFTAFDLASNPTAVSLAFRSDDDPPVVQSSSPTGVSALTTSVSVTFGELMDKDTMQGAVTFERTIPIPAVLPVTLNRGDFGFDFTPTLQAAATYRVTVSTGITDLAGVPLGAAFSFAFTTP